MNIDLQAREIAPLRNTYAHVAKYIGNDKPASRYQEATYGAQPMSNFHYRPTWDPEHELFDTSRSAVVLADWYVLKDPRQLYYATWTAARARQQDAMESSFQFVESRGMVEDSRCGAREGSAGAHAIAPRGLGRQHEQRVDLRLRLWHRIHRAGHVPCDGQPGRG